MNIREIEERRADLELWKPEDYGVNEDDPSLVRGIMAACKDIDALLEDRAGLCRKCNDQESEILRLKVLLRNE